MYLSIQILENFSLLFCFFNLYVVKDSYTYGLTARCNFFNFVCAGTPQYQKDCTFIKFMYTKSQNFVSAEPRAVYLPEVENGYHRVSLVRVSLDLGVPTKAFVLNAMVAAYILVECSCLRVGRLCQVGHCTFLLQFVWRTIRDIFNK